LTHARIDLVAVPLAIAAMQRARYHGPAMNPRCLIIRSAGVNCDLELEHAFRLAGADTTRLHLNALIADPSALESADLVGFPGGFSYGDDIAAGRIFANRLKHHLFDPIRAAIDRGVAMIGICNGFQVLVKMGLLPDPHVGEQTVTLADNATPRFIDRWVRLETPTETRCVWTKGLGEIELPIAHGEGRFAVQSQGRVDRLAEHGQIALRYAADDNPNGSTADIAGICDPTGLVLGLMPHPERFVDPTHHPQWPRKGDDFLQTTPAGLAMIRNAVEHVAAARV